MAEIPCHLLEVLHLRLRLRWNHRPNLVKDFPCLCEGHGVLIRHNDVPMGFLGASCFVYRVFGLVLVCPYVLVMQRAYKGFYEQISQLVLPAVRGALLVHHRCPGSRPLSGPLGVCPLLGFFLLLLVLDWHKKILSFERVQSTIHLDKTLDKWL